MEVLKKKNKEKKKFVKVKIAILDKPKKFTNFLFCQKAEVIKFCVCLNNRTVIGQVSSIKQ